MFKMDTKLLKNIIKSRKDIRRKFNAIKTGKIENEFLLEETFKPITKSLKKMNTKLNQNEIKNLMKNEKMEEDNEHDYKNEKMEDNEYDYNDDDDNNNGFSDPNDSFKTDNTYEDNSHKPISNNEEERLKGFYLSELKNKNNFNIDRSFGPKYIDENELQLGREKIAFLNNVIIVGDEKYPATQGLYELIFMKSPSDYSETDLKNYSDIILQTNVYRTDVNDETSKIKGNSSDKYKNVIKNIISNKKGSGLMLYNKIKPNYIFWDDPNELVDRLKLLIASQEAGHSNHNNEIISIIEELKEAGIIS